MRDQIRFMYAYNAWANNRILDACAPLPTLQLTTGEGYSTIQPSIRDTLVHTMSAQETWLKRWGGFSPTQGLNPVDFATLEEIRVYWDQLESHTRGFLEAIDEDNLAREITYTNYSGNQFSYPLWQIMLHQTNHATQHRSEIAQILTVLGHSPGALDIPVYLDETKP